MPEAVETIMNPSRESVLIASIITLILFVVGSIMLSSCMCSSTVTQTKYICEESGCTEVLTNRDTYKGKPVFKTKEECNQTCNSSPSPTNPSPTNPTARRFAYTGIA